MLREMGRKTPSVSVVIVTAGQRVISLRRLLRALAGQSRSPDEVIVVDNASSDDTCDLLAHEFPLVRVLRQERNLGCPGGRNAGIQQSRGEIIVCLDDDATCGAETLAGFAAAMAKYPRAGVIAARIADPESGAATVGAEIPPHPVFRFSGGAAALRRAALKEVGLYPAHFWRQAEELDLAWRLWDRGWEIIRDPSITICHPVARFSPSLARFQTRNEIWVAWRNLPPFHAFAWALWKSLTYPLRYARRGGALWAVVGATEGWLGWRRERRRGRAVNREVLGAFRRLRSA
jgi:hypothetical protein